MGVGYERFKWQIGDHLKGVLDNIQDSTDSREVLLKESIWLIPFAYEKYGLLNLAWMLMVDAEDLAQEGLKSFFESHKGYKQSENTKFSTYFVRILRNNGFNYIAQRSRMIRYPVNIHNKFGEYNELIENGNLNDEKIRRRLAILEPIVADGSRRVLFESDIFNDNGDGKRQPTFADRVESNGDGCSSEFVNEEYDDYIVKLISNTIAKLPLRDQEIIRLYFGINSSEKDVPGKTACEIGKYLGISDARVRQLKKRSLEYLGRELNRKNKHILEEMVA